MKYSNLLPALEMVDLMSLASLGVLVRGSEYGMNVEEVDRMVDVLRNQLLVDDKNENETPRFHSLEPIFYVANVAERMVQPQQDVRRLIG